MPPKVQQLTFFCRYLVQRFTEDNCPKNAAALTYTTLFAVVPVMTVSYAMLAAIPSFSEAGSQIENFIFQNFVPSTGVAVQQYLSDFSNQARQLTGIGVAVLLVTAFLMITNIEKSFNAIWRIRQPRRGVSSFLLYWAVLSLGPLLLGAGFVVSTYLTSMAFMGNESGYASAGRWMLGWVPLLLSMAAFTLLFVAVPNTRVPLRHGLIGGVLVALLFEGAKACFALYVALFPGYQLIYGAFAAFPLFLLWIYISWLIILAGAELVANLGNGSAWNRPVYPWVINLLGLLRMLLDAQSKGETVDLHKVNRAGWVVHEHLWLELTGWLEARNLITRAHQGGYVLSRDLDRTEMADLLAMLPEPMPPVARLPSQLAGEPPWYPRFLSAVAELEAQRDRILSGSLKSWLDDAPAAASAVESRNTRDMHT